MIISSGFKSGMQAAGRLAAHTLDYIESRIVVGMTTFEIDRLCNEYIQQHGGKSGCHGYKGYPGNVCVSPYEVVCHGIPDGRKVCDGDIIYVDVVVELNGYYGDTARTFCIGNVNPETKRLVEVTYEARDRGIAAVRAGATTGDIGHVIESFVNAAGYKVIKAYCGHGIGHSMHEKPLIRNYGNPSEGAQLQAGKCITVEPIVTLGSDSVRELEDGWTVITNDNAWTAQCEHTLYITHDGCEIMTLGKSKFAKL